MKGDYPIPFTKNGNQLTYAEPWMERNGSLQWFDNFEFEDTLEIDSMSRGRSAANFTFRRQSNGAEVTVFMTDMIDIFKKARGGKVKGKFTFIKRGQNYGCKLA